MSKTVFIYGEKDSSGNFCSVSIRTYSLKAVIDVKASLADQLFRQLPQLQIIFIQFSNGSVEYTCRHMNGFWAGDEHLWREKNWQLLEESDLFRNSPLHTSYNIRQNSTVLA